MRRLILAAAPIAVLGGMFTASSHALAAGTTTLYVSTTGSDSNPCTQAKPCKTLQYAVDQAPVGAFIHVAAGTYMQTVNINKPLTIQGAGQGATIIDGSNVDEGSMGYYAVIQVSNNTSGTSGTTSIHDLTVQGAFVTAAESQSGSSPIDIGVYGDSQASDHVRVYNVTLGAVQDNTDYYGIGFYTLNTAATVSLTTSTLTGNFQGALLEGSTGPATVKSNTISAVTTGGYAGEGVFVLSDTSGLSTATVTKNTFTGYAGDGLDAEAGYSGGNCGPPNPVCGGDLMLTATGNKFTLGGASGAAAIYLIANSGNTLTATVTGNSGTVTKPTEGIRIESRSGIMHITQHSNSIKQA